MRRSSFEDRPTDYAAVGATQAPDLLQYPPAGFVPYEDSIKIGSGDDRFEKAASLLLTWQVQRRAGVRVSEIIAGTGDTYRGVRFADDGTPIAPGEPQTEERYSADGTPYVSSGTSARLAGRIGAYSLRGHVRVVYVHEDEDSVAFALGTVDGHSVSGEESFAIERTADGSVMFRTRAFIRPAGIFYRFLPFLLSRRRKRIAVEYLKTLSPAWAGDVREL